AQNVGFSLAIDEIERLIPELEAGKGDITPDTAVLGVAAVSVDASLDPTVREDLGVTADSGALITAVEPESAAGDAGIQEGDVVVELDGKAIATNEQLTDEVRSHAPGDQVTITVERDGRRRSFDVTLGPS